MKVPVFPFNKFLGVDPILGPEMKSTGEVMGFGKTFAEAFIKAHLAVHIEFRPGGKAFLSVRDADKFGIVEVGRALIDVGFILIATNGTARVLQEAGLACERINKVTEGRPHIVDMIKNDEIDFIVNTTEGKQSTADSYTIRRSALQRKINYTTTLAGGRACALAFALQQEQEVQSLQELHQQLAKEKKS